MKAHTFPSLEEREKPGLWETLDEHEDDADICRGCGIHTSATIEGLLRWRECDAWDQPTGRIVVLCQRCSDTLIEPHARLYIPVPLGEPVPGMTRICRDCTHRSGTTCPLSKAWGGAGVMFRFDRPALRSISCTRGRHGGCRHNTDYGIVVACAQKEGIPAGQAWPAEAT